MVQPGEIEKIQERLKENRSICNSTSIEEKEVNTLYVSLDVKYIIYLEFVRMESWMTSV